jgi:uncharacterized protein (TIGR02145 family)
MIKSIETAKLDFAKLRKDFLELNTFMSTEAYDRLDDTEASLIDKQVDGMYNYLTALGKRIGEDILAKQETPFEAVDLGLPSGLKWANMNLGANTPEESGLYFSFDDANKADLGEKWHIPTREDFQELCDHCTSEWATENGVYGRRFTSKVNGNSIFFPAAGYYYGTALYDRGSYGYYWSASRYSDSSGYYLYFNSGFVYPQLNYNRRYGFSVRAVQ